MIYNDSDRKEVCRTQMKKFRKGLSILLCCAGAVFLAGALFLLFRQFWDDRNTRNTVNELQSAADASREPAPFIPPSASPGNTDAPGPEPSVSPHATPESTPTPTENPFRDSFLANSDMAAWLQIPDTVISYPVVWTPEDENYYLRRGFDGSANRNGCLILDTDSCVDPLTTNLIIHGHNMKSGAMFGTLNRYEDEDFFREHRTILLYTEQCCRSYEVIAVFRSQVYKKSEQVFKYYKFFQADTEEEFNDFYENIMALSLYDTGVTAAFGDHFLTLSTCSYHVEQGRFVVVAKETECGDPYLPLETEAP